MARPITHLEELSKLAEDIKPKETRSIIDITVDSLRNKPTKYLLLGTITGKLNKYFTIYIPDGGNIR